jgi:hypothetical protein
MSRWQLDQMAMSSAIERPELDVRFLQRTTSEEIDDHLLLMRWATNAHGKRSVCT